MAKVVLNEVGSGYNLRAINDNFAKIETALDDGVLWRDNPEGEPNALITDIDANSQRIYNLPVPASDTEPARIKDVRDLIQTVISSGDASALALDLASTTDSSKGAGQIGFSPSLPYSDGTVGKWLKNLTSSTGATVLGWIQTVTGAVQRTVSQKLTERISAFDFMTEAQIADVQAGTLLLDVTIPLQAFVSAVSSSSSWIGKKGWLPAGKYKITAPLVIPSQYITIEGDGMWSSGIYFNGVASGLKCATMQYLRPILKDFSIIGDATSGIALDFGGITASPRGECYGGDISRMYLQSGGKSLYAPFVFSTKFDTVWGHSFNDHALVAACGPAVTWLNCYAIQTGAGKAGYRMRGIITLSNCNGVNSADWWGIFGEDKTATDGYQNDFPTRSDSDTPAVYLEGCNIEEFASISSNGGGLMMHNIWRYFKTENCKFDRNNLATPYKAIIQIRKPSNAPGQMVQLGTNAVFPGTGVPSLSALYADTGGAFLDSNGDFAGSGISTFKVGSSGLNYPTIKTQVNFDVYNDVAFQYNALTARRFTTQMTRYAVKTINPVGLVQPIDVTGHTKVLVSPAAASTIEKAIFSQVIGGSTDYDRNGDLIVEAANGNVTLIHSATGADTFKLSAGVNLTMTAGQVLRFCRSETTSQWVQV